MGFDMGFDLFVSFCFLFYIQGYRYTSNAISITQNSNGGGAVPHAFIKKYTLRCC